MKTYDVSLTLATILSNNQDHQKWCDENVDRSQGDWWKYQWSLKEHGILFRFSNEKDALLFKLKFG